MGGKAEQALLKEPGFMDVTTDLQLKSLELVIRRG